MTDLPVYCQVLTKQRWADFAALFGANGACGGCWCMLWRISPKDFDHGKGAGNRRAMKALVAAGAAPGLLAYHDRTPVGWCSVAPRDSFPALQRSRVLQPVDARPCWSVSCLFVHRAYRRRGVSRRLLQAAVGFARQRGARRLEGYPVAPRSGEPVPAAFAWNGIASAFTAAGFVEVARRSPTRPIMRIEV